MGHKESMSICVVRRSLWLGESNRRPARPWTGIIAKSLAFLIVGLVGAASSPAQAAWWPLPHAKPAASQAPDQSWLNDVPERPGSRQSKVAVFVFPGDDVYQPIRAAVVGALRHKGLNVTTTLRQVDSPAQYREMSSTLKVGVYVDGEVTGEGARQSAHIRVRSGVTGQHVAVANFTGPTTKIVGAITRTLWARVGAATAHACAGTAHSHRREREPLRLEAGSPLDDASMANRGT